MTAAVLLFWAGCLWSITRSVLWLIWTASPWRQLVALAILALALSSCRSPEELRRKYNKSLEPPPGL